MESANASEILLGRADIRVDNNYSLNIASTTAVLDNSYSIGSCENSSIKEDKQFKDKRIVDVLQSVDKIITLNKVIITISTLKANSNNFGLLFGTDGSGGDQFVGGTNKNYFRVELVFTYPDKVSQMKVIVPKAIVADPNSLNLITLDNPSQIEFSFESLYPNSSSWGNNSARIIFP